MTNIISFFGTKNSGKTSCGLFVYGAYMHALDLIKGGYCIKEDGLHISDLGGDAYFQGRFDPYRNNPTMKEFLANNIDPYIKLYSFADDLKSFCINVLGLKWEQCYGANADKDSLTHLKWEDMPGILNEDILGEPLSIPELRLEKDGYWYDAMYPNKIALNHASGFMTGREVMQYFGTEIVRRMYGPAWAKSTLSRIRNEQPILAVITDGRFQDELDEVKSAGGKCIKLLRHPFEDQHDSEKIPIKDEDFDAIIDNSKMNLDEQNDELIKVLEPWEVLPEMKILG